MSIACTFASHQDARKAGWFSRRHQTDAAHRAAQEVWREQQRQRQEREQRQRETARTKHRVEFA